MLIFRFLPPAQEGEKQPLQSFEQKGSTDFFQVLATDSALLWRKVPAVLASFRHTDCAIWCQTTKEQIVKIFLSSSWVLWLSLRCCVIKCYRTPPLCFHITHPFVSHTGLLYLISLNPMLFENILGRRTHYFLCFFLLLKKFKSFQTVHYFRNANLKKSGIKWTLCVWGGGGRGSKRSECTEC